MFELSGLGPNGVFGPPTPAAVVGLTNDSDGYQGFGAALPSDGAAIEDFPLDQTNNPAYGNIVAGQVIATVRPAGAAPTFEPPTQLSTAVGIPCGPATGSAAGTTTILWAQSTGCKERIYAALRPPGGSFAPGAAITQNFTTQGVLCGHNDNAELTIDGAGRYLIAGWLQSDVLRVATLASPRFDAETALPVPGVVRFWDGAARSSASGSESTRRPADDRVWDDLRPPSPAGSAVALCRRSANVRSDLRTLARIPRTVAVVFVVSVAVGLGQWVSETAGMLFVGSGSSFLAVLWLRHGPATEDHPPNSR